MNKIGNILALIFVLLIGGVLGGIFLFRDFLREINFVMRSPIDLPQLIEDSTDDAGKKGDIPLDLPPGIDISVYVKDLPGARVIIPDTSGNMLVSQTSQGKVVALVDKDKDGKAEEVRTVIDGLSRPHGLALKCEDRDERECSLYVAEERQVLVFDYDAGSSTVSDRKKIIDLPGGAGHNTRSLLITEVDGRERLLVSIGSSCNVCFEDDARRAAVYSSDLDGRDFKPFAVGLRNSVFMAENPNDGKVWATEMGRDLLGDEQPPDEINILEEGKNYGWPICYGRNIHDTVFDKRTYARNPCEEPSAIPSHIDVPAHNAPLGIAFFPSEGWPEEYRNDALVALHGSWNSSVPVGYKMVRVKIDNEGKFTGFEDFVTGWLTEDNKTTGRPVGIIIEPRGVIYFSDDSRGAVYKLSVTFNK